MSSTVESVQAQKSGIKSAPHKVPQPHGGALLSGGVPGNKGSTGRPRSEIRALAREINAQSLELLKSKLAELTDKDVNMNDLCRAAEVTGKFGLGDAQPEAVADAEVVQRIFRYLKEERGIDPGELRDYEAWERDRY